MLVRLKSIFTFQHSIILLICLIALALRLGPLFDNRFHPDEALFSTWALKIARGENWLLTGVPVDKPPLLIYLTALSFFVFGQSELAARLPNLIASVVSVVLVWRLGVGRLGNGKLVTPPSFSDQYTNYQFTNDRLTDLLPPLLLALSPFAILFAPTAFLDPMMVMFGLASLVAASRGRAGWAGILLGLSFATKVQGLFFLPLIPVFWSGRGNRVPSKLSGKKFGQKPGFSVPIGMERTTWRNPVSLLHLHSTTQFALGLVAIGLCVLLWDRTRGGLPFWVQQSINYGGIRVIYPSELGPRFTGWLNLLPYFFGPIIGALGLIGLPILIYRDFTREARTRSAWIDLWLLTYTIGFFALHWFLAFPVWDRYFLILVPVVALLLGRAVHYLIAFSARYRVTPFLFFFLLLIFTTPFSLAAAASQYPIGGDHGANDGVEQVAAYLKALPAGTVVYDHWLAWQLDYYLGEGFAYVAYFDTPAALADDLRVFGRDDTRYVIFPVREAPAKVSDAIGQVGYTLTPVFATRNRFGQTSFTIYRIVESYH